MGTVESAFYQQSSLTGRGLPQGGNFGEPLEEVRTGEVGPRGLAVELEGGAKPVSESRGKRLRAGRLAEPTGFGRGCEMRLVKPKLHGCWALRVEVLRLVLLEPQDFLWLGEGGPRARGVWLGCGLGGW